MRKPRPRRGERIDRGTPKTAGSLHLRADFRSLATSILPALVERRARLDAGRFDSQRAAAPGTSTLNAARARHFERAVKPFCRSLRICAREEPCASVTAENADRHHTLEDHHDATG